MKINTLECPNCGAHLNIKTDANKGKCSYCRVSYTLNNGVVKTNYNNNPELKHAETILYKFKDYEQSEMLFRKLLSSMIDEARVYIGLILSISHDFKFNTSSLFEITSIIEYWKKYCALSEDENILKYESKFKKYVSNFWITKLKSETDNFTDYTTTHSLAVLSSYLSSYSMYASESEYNKLKEQFDIYKINRDAYEKKNKRIKLICFCSIFFIIIVCGLLFYNMLKNDEPKVIKDTVNISNIINYPYCNAEYDCTNYNFVLDNFKNILSELKVENASIDRDNSKLSFTINLTNFFISKSFNYEFDIIDDIGPYIVDKKCTFTDTSTIDLNGCYDIESFNKNIVIDNSAIIIDDDDINYKDVGEKNIGISFKYNDITITSHISVYIVKSDIEFNFSLDKNEFEKNKLINYHYSFDKNILDKDVEFDYDESYIKISNNSIVGIKEGKTKLCAYPLYDETQIKCIDVIILPNCKGTYNFTYDGLTENKIVVGKDICPGIYKVYVGVVNSSSYYHMYIRKESGAYKDTISIYKKYEHSNEEGQNFSFPIDHYLNVPVGVTSVKLIKQ